MSDENKSMENGDAENFVDLKPGASKKDLKDAADAFLKANKDTPATDEPILEVDEEPEILVDPVLILEAELADTKDKMLRTLAEAENIRKRSAKEVMEARVFAIEKFAGDLLSVSDNMSRALEAMPEDERATLSERGQNLLGGIEMTQKELHAVFARNGVTAIDAAPGDAFDPNMHQAVANVPSEHTSGSIAECFQPGWKIGERVLRAAMVAVSSGAAS